MLTRPNKYTQILSSQFYRSSIHTQSTIHQRRNSSSSSKSLPNEADVIVIGGGAIGTSTLYHLSTMGVNAILLEKDQITAGTTWHSAGLLWRLRPNDTEIKLIDRTRELVKTNGILEQETGLLLSHQESSHQHLHSITAYSSHNLFMHKNVNSNVLTLCESGSIDTLTTPMISL